MFKKTMNSNYVKRENTLLSFVFDLQVLDCFVVNLASGEHEILLALALGEKKIQDTLNKIVKYSLIFLSFPPLGLFLVSLAHRVTEGVLPRHSDQCP